MRFFWTCCLVCSPNTRKLLSAAELHQKSSGSLFPEPGPPPPRWTGHLRDRERAGEWDRSYWLNNRTGFCWGVVTVEVITKATPGHDGAGVSCGDALQDGGLVDINGEVLRSGQDDGFPVDPGSCNWSHRNQKTSETLRVYMKKLRLIGGHWPEFGLLVGFLLPWASSYRWRTAGPHGCTECWQY